MFFLCGEFSVYSLLERKRKKKPLDAGCRDSPMNMSLWAKPSITFEKKKINMLILMYECLHMLMFSYNFFSDLLLRISVSLFGM